MSRDAWTVETPEERARRLMRLNDYANTVAWSAMAMDRLAKLAGKATKEEKQKWLGSRFTSETKK